MLPAGAAHRFPGDQPDGTPLTDAAHSAYRVLARKYRPATFADLIGQEAMVRTLRNAFEADRIAHAFVLTGVRGVGKTTTARIVAKGLNCVGPDGQGGVTIEPCGVCGPCVSIAEGRHVDVLEMDAATHTQVEKMRDLLASVPYRPTDVRYKVYIIDEVHMLSTSAFNALLKTLEEPPAHVKFIFATTEIRKVPVTVLSRCQRFDLRRIEPQAMLEHLAAIAAKEAVEVAPDALALIVRAAEGSVRDALSLLDQAIAHGAGATGAAEVRAMLGLADRGRVLDLFEAVMAGDARGALAELGAQYSDGADPSAVLRDLAEVAHWVSVVKLSPEAADDPTVGPDERARGLGFAERLPLRALARYARFEDVAALVRARRDVSLLIEIEQGVRLVKYAPGRIEFEPADGAAPDLAARLGQRLQLWTGVRWGVSVVGSGGAATIAELREAERAGLHARAAAHPMVQAVLAAFPGAEIREVRTADGPEAGPAVLAPAPEAGEDEDDDWDPFDPASEE